MTIMLRFTAGTGYDANGARLSDIAVERAVRLIRRGLAEGFGGYTETVTRGGWYDEERQALVEERGRRWEVVAEADTALKAQHTARWIAELLNQKAVLLEAGLVSARFVSPVSEVQEASA